MMRIPSKPLLLVALFAAVIIGCTPDATEEKPDASLEPIVQVQTIKLQKSEISETLTAYGTVLPWPDKLQTISVPYTSRIEKILVNEGQSFQKGDELLLLRPADDAILQLQQANVELNAAQHEQQLVQERLNLKLATQMELATAKLRTEQAKVMIANLAERGINHNHQLKADHAGIVHLLSVQQNQIVPAGSPILQWVDKNQWVVRVGVEPEDFERLQLGQEVLLKPTNKPSSQPIKGRIATITNQIDPVTRLLNVFVKPESNQTLLINDYIEARIMVSSANTLVAPRQTLLPDGKAYRLFTIEKGHAILHKVQIGLENDTQAEVIANDLKEQDEIVVLGNYELEDGMAVEVQKP
jgi:membrane fusion protein, multidrug efflux system